MPYRAMLAVPGQPDVVAIREKPAGKRGSCWRMLTLSTGVLGPQVACGTSSFSANLGPDARHLIDVEGLLDRPVLGKWVVSEDADLRELKPGVLALPAAWLLGP